jgi:hypothetical protein
VADGDERSISGSRREDDDVSIWSTDDIPVHADPLEIVWSRADRSNGPPDMPIEPWSADDTGAPDPPGTPDPANGRSSATSGRTRLLITGAALLAIAIVGALVARTGSDDSATDTTATDTTMPDTTMPDTTSDSSPAPATTVPGTIAPVGDPTDEAGTPTPSSAARIELPPLVDAIEQPTEVIALSADGTVHTLSLPSGRVTSVPVGSSGGADAFGFGGNQVIVAPDAAAIGPVDGEFVVIPRVGPPLGVELDAFGDDVGGLQAFGWRSGDDGGTRFVVAVYPSDAGDVRIVSIDTAGTVEELPLSEIELFGRLGPTIATSDGSWIVNDAGGAYEVEPDGSARRIENGIVYAAVEDHRLVRDCDESQTCSTIIVTLSTGERRVLDPTVLPDDFTDLAYGMALSPDGSAALLQRSTFESSRVLVDFRAGEVASWPVVNWSPATEWTWAADSSGVFDTSSDGDGLRFVARTGESVTFADEMGSIVALGVRRPDAELEPTATVVESAAVPDRPLDATGLVLAAAGRSGGMSSIDIDAGVTSSWATSGRLGQGSGTLAVGIGSTIVLPGSDAVAYATSPGTETVLGDEFSVDGPKFPGPAPGTIWIPAAENSPPAATAAYELVGVDGVPSGDLRTSFAFSDAVVLGSDGRGGLVVTRGGTVFTLGVDGAEFLTTGDLVAIGADTAYVRECADIATCDILRLDRRTGERTPVDGLGDLSPVAIVSDERGAALGTSVAPGGEVLMVEVPSPDGQVWTMFDAATGALTQLTDLAIDQPVVWNDDASFAAFLADSSLAVYDRASQQVVAVDTVPLRAIGPAPGDG